MAETNDFYCDFVLNHTIEVKTEFESDEIFAFRHTKPTYDFHVVIVPKQHIANMSELADISLVARIFSVIKSLIATYELETKNYRVITNGGSFQDSKHLHFHLISGEKLPQ